MKKDKSFAEYILGNINNIEKRFEKSVYGNNSDEHDTTIDPSTPDLNTVNSEDTPQSSFINTETIDSNTFSTMRMVKNANFEKFDKVHMETAVIWSKLSYCKRGQVGAVISLKDRTTIPAYNGTISGTNNKCEDTCPNCNGDGKVFKNNTTLLEMIFNNDIVWNVSKLTLEDFSGHYENSNVPIVIVNKGEIVDRQYKKDEYIELKGYAFSLVDLYKINKITFKDKNINDNITICNKCGGGGIVTNDFTLHAEANAITHAAKEGISLYGTTIYITKSPCKECSKLIAQSGIKRVVYKTKYKDTSGLDFLRSIGGIVVDEYNSNKG